MWVGGIGLIRMGHDFSHPSHGRISRTCWGCAVPDCRPLSKGTVWMGRSLPRHGAYLQRPDVRPKLRRTNMENCFSNFYFGIGRHIVT